MTKLDGLINELCPNGVEYKKIKDVFDRVKGTPITATKMKEIEKPDGEIKIFAGGKTVINANEEDIPHANIIRVPAVLVQSRGIIDFVYYEKPFTFKNEMWAYTTEEKTTVKFLYYVFKNNSSYFRDASSGMGSMPQISLRITEDFIIPVPPLEVQREIVRILDNFTECTAEFTATLTAELTARKKQYEYYSGSLFPSVNESDFNWVELGKIATVTKLAGFEFTKYVKYSDEGNIIALRGLNVKNGHLDLEDVKYIDNSDLEMLKRSKLHIDDMLFTYVGTVGQVALVDKEDKYFLAPNVALIRINKEEYIPKYMMYYFLTDKFRYEQIFKLLQSSSMKNIPMEKIRKFKLPEVPIEEQQKIIDILDHLHMFCNDITQCLSDEIEARYMQYEYYRNQLLTLNGGI